ncbi:MAG TPA: CBS domain-containing protein [Burkholderiales bacterium]|nr:CBS domain-containing protein [Burkholderiales bacterium]
MQRSYTAMPASGVYSGIAIHQPPTADARQVSLESPALEVMTDFTRVRPLTIQAHATMEHAQQRMASHHVHLLLVTDEGGRLAGLITSTDIEGEKPVRVVHERGIRRAEILVSDVMTPLERLEVLDMDDVLHARVGHVVATLRAVGRQHAMIVDFHNGAMKVRGLFSVSQVARQLGTPVETVEIARSFAQVGEMLAH